MSDLSLPTLQAVLPALAPEALCVTATRRQMHELLRVQAQSEQALGKTVWKTAQVVPWEAYLKQVWSSVSQDTRALLDDATALRLWRSLISDSDSGSTLLDQRQTAQAAYRSYQLACQWQIPMESMRPQTPEEAAFKDWASRYQTLLADKGFIDNAQLSGLLLDQPIDVKRPLFVHGLGDAPPASRALMQHWSRLGQPVHTVQAPPIGITPRTKPVRSPEDELQACAAWVLARISLQPDARLVIQWPRLKDQAPALLRRLDDLLYPLSLRPGAPPERPYALASSMALSEFGVVHCALQLLELARSHVPLSRLSHVLRSPYLSGDETASGERAKLDVRLRADYQHEWHGEQLLHALKSGLMKPLQPLTPLLESLRTPTLLSLEAWASLFGRALNDAGWPGSRRLQSDEYQTVEKFKSALAELALRSRVLPALTLEQALDELLEVTRGIEFQPEAGNASVLFMDGPTNLGYPVEGLWVAGLDTTRFPASLQPDPFLPLQAQRDAGLPGASPVDGGKQAQRLLQDWQSWAGELVLSVAAFDGKAEQRPSPLLNGLEELPPQPVPSRYASLIRSLSSREPSPNDALPALLPGAPITGGSAALEDQAACAFRAALRGRFGVRELGDPGPGIAATLRGKLAHAALAHLWKDLKNSDTLNALNSTEQDDAVRLAIEAAKRELKDSLPVGRLADLEYQWLQRVIKRSLTVDSQRPAFTVIAIEQAMEFDFEGHALRIKIDRLDELSTGERVLIDYKTGRTVSQRWFEEPLRDVQLPLYAAHLSHTPQALVHAHLPVSCDPYKGRAEALGLTPGLTLTEIPYDDTIAAWRRQTQQLANDFIQGRAEVAPQPDACRYCSHAIVCRVVSDPAEASSAGEGNVHD